MKIKHLLGFALVLGMSLIYSPGSIALTMNESKGPGASSNSACPAKFSIIAGTSGFNDPGLLLRPKYNCDTKMCITTVPNIDPEFLIRDLPK